LAAGIPGPSRPASRQARPSASMNTRCAAEPRRTGTSRWSCPPTPSSPPSRPLRRRPAGCATGQVGSGSTRPRRAASVDKGLPPASRTATSTVLCFGEPRSTWVSRASRPHLTEQPELHRVLPPVGTGVLRCHLPGSDAAWVLDGCSPESPANATRRTGGE
jgi:hypothetical protein